MAGPGRLRHRVGEAILDRHLWTEGDRVAVAVSGGLDSICLLDLLIQTRQWHGARLEVVTVDHGTRDGSADDARFVEGVAAALDLECTRFDLDLGPDTSEADARTARYHALSRVRADRIALGHHRDDQAETVLLMLMRGTGPRGFGGMPWRRGRYVRPLLDTARADLEGWARMRRLEWREDPTNASPRFLRNRVRREVLPLLESLREGTTAAIARSAGIAASEGALLDRLVDDEPHARHGTAGWNRRWVAHGPEPLVRRALHRAHQGLRTAHVDAVLKAARRGSGVVELPDGARIRVVKGRVRIEHD